MRTIYEDVDDEFGRSQAMRTEAGRDQSQSKSRSSDSVSRTSDSDTESSSDSEESGSSSESVRHHPRYRRTEHGRSPASPSSYARSISPAPSRGRAPSKSSERSPSVESAYENEFFFDEHKPEDPFAIKTTTPLALEKTPWGRVGVADDTSRSVSRSSSRDSSPLRDHHLGKRRRGSDSSESRRSRAPSRGRQFEASRSGSDDSDSDSSSSSDSEASNESSMSKSSKSSRSSTSSSKSSRSSTSSSSYSESDEPKTTTMYRPEGMDDPQEQGRRYGMYRPEGMDEPGVVRTAYQGWLPPTPRSRAAMLAKNGNKGSEAWFSKVNHAVASQNDLIARRMQQTDDDIAQKVQKQAQAPPAVSAPEDSDISTGTSDAMSARYASPSAAGGLTISIPPASPTDSVQDAAAILENLHETQLNSASAATPSTSTVLANTPSTAAPPTPSTAFADTPLNRGGSNNGYAEFATVPAFNNRASGGLHFGRMDEPGSPSDSSSSLSDIDGLDDDDDVINQLMAHAPENTPLEQVMDNSGPPGLEEQDTAETVDIHHDAAAEPEEKSPSKQPVMASTAQLDHTETTFGRKHMVAATQSQTTTETTASTPKSLGATTVGASSWKEHLRRYSSESQSAEDQDAEASKKPSPIVIPSVPADSEVGFGLPKRSPQRYDSLGNPLPKTPKTALMSPPAPRQIQTRSHKEKEAEAVAVEAQTPDMTSQILSPPAPRAIEERQEHKVFPRRGRLEIDLDNMISPAITGASTLTTRSQAAHFAPPAFHHATLSPTTGTLLPAGYQGAEGGYKHAPTTNVNELGAVGGYHRVPTTLDAAAEPSSSEDEIEMDTSEPSELKQELTAELNDITSGSRPSNVDVHRHKRPVEGNYDELIAASLANYDSDVDADYRNEAADLVSQLKSAADHPATRNMGLASFRMEKEGNYAELLQQVMQEYDEETDADYQPPLSAEEKKKDAENPMNHQIRVILRGAMRTLGSTSTHGSDAGSVVVSDVMSSRGSSASLSADAASTAAAAAGPPRSLGATTVGSPSWAQHLQRYGSASASASEVSTANIVPAAAGSNPRRPKTTRSGQVAWGRVHKKRRPSVEELSIKTESDWTPEENDIHNESEDSANESDAAFEYDEDNASDNEISGSASGVASTLTKKEVADGVKIVNGRKMTKKQRQKMHIANYYKKKAAEASKAKEAEGEAEAEEDVTSDGKPTPQEVAAGVNTVDGNKMSKQERQKMHIANYYKSIADFDHAQKAKDEREKIEAAAREAKSQYRMQLRDQKRREEEANERQAAASNTARTPAVEVAAVDHQERAAVERARIEAAAKLQGQARSEAIMKLRDEKRREEAQRDRASAAAAAAAGLTQKESELREKALRAELQTRKESELREKALRAELRTRKESELREKALRAELQTRKESELREKALRAELLRRRESELREKAIRAELLTRLDAKKQELIAKERTEKLKHIEAQRQELLELIAQKKKEIQHREQAKRDRERLDALAIEQLREQELKEQAERKQQALLEAANQARAQLDKEEAEEAQRVAIEHELAEEASGLDAAEYFARNAVMHVTRNINGDDMSDLGDDDLDLAQAVQASLNDQQYQQPAGFQPHVPLLDLHQAAQYADMSPANSRSSTPTTDGDMDIADENEIDALMGMGQPEQQYQVGMVEAPLEGNAGTISDSASNASLDPDLIADEVLSDHESELSDAASSDSESEMDEIDLDEHQAAILANRASSSTGADADVEFGTCPVQRNQFPQRVRKTSLGIIALLAASSFAPQAQQAIRNLPALAAPHMLQIAPVAPEALYEPPSLNPVASAFAFLAPSSSSQTAAPGANTVAYSPSSPAPSNMWPATWWSGAAEADADVGAAPSGPSPDLPEAQQQQPPAESLNSEIQKTLALLDDLKTKAESLVECTVDRNTGAETCVVPEQSLAQITPSQSAAWGSYLRSYLPDVSTYVSRLRSGEFSITASAAPACDVAAGAAEEDTEGEVQISITDRFGAVIKRYSLFGDAAEVRD